MDLLPMELHGLGTLELNGTVPTTGYAGQRRFELKDHLGNVCVTITGDRYGVDQVPQDGFVDYSVPKIVGWAGYEPFGSLLPGRNYSSDSYRFGFQGQEKDDEIHGATGTSLAFEYRMEDSRIGRFQSIDPLASKYPHYSPYHFAGNSPIANIDLEGLEDVYYMGRIIAGTQHAAIQLLTSSSSYKQDMSLFTDPQFNKGVDLVFVQGSTNGASGGTQPSLVPSSHLSTQRWRDSKYGALVGEVTSRSVASKGRDLAIVTLPAGGFESGDQLAATGSWQAAAATASAALHEIEAHVLNLTAGIKKSEGLEHKEYFEEPTPGAKQWGVAHESPADWKVLRDFPNSKAATGIRSIQEQRDLRNGRPFVGDMQIRETKINHEPLSEKTPNR